MREKDQVENVVRTSTQSAWGSYLPEDLLLDIFDILIYDCKSPIPVLCRTAQVCTYWRSVSYHKNLWKNVDLSSGWIDKRVPGIQQLCETRLGYHTHSINLEAWFRLGDEHLNIIDEHCPNLKTLNLSSCDNLTDGATNVLANKFSNLQAIELSNVAPIVLGVKDLDHFLKEKGHQLIKLVLSMNNVSRGFVRNMTTIYTTCAQLLHLDLRHVTYYGHNLFLNVDALQRGCPKLRTFLLEGTNVSVTNNVSTSNGFIDLEEFSAPFEEIRENEQTCLSMVLKSSFKLKRLKFYMHNEELSLYDLPAENLEYLRLPYTLTSHDVLQQIRWKQSLKVLELDWLTGISRVDFDATIKILFTQKPTFAKLHRISLSATKLSWQGIGNIMDSCRTLKVLNCTFCPNIPQFWAKELHGQLLQQLYKLINEGMALEELKLIQDNISQQQSDAI